MRATARSGRRARQEVARPQRGRILDAAFRAFMRDGFARTSTLAIASAANVSKRELYAQFGSKQALLGACINARADRMRAPARAAVIADRDGLVRTLIAFGAAILREASDPAVIGVFRLAITEARRSPHVAAMLNQAGREANHVVLAGLLEQAQSLRSHRARSAAGAGGTVPRPAVGRLVVAAAAAGRQASDPSAGASSRGPRYARFPEAVWTFMKICTDGLIRIDASSSSSPSNAVLIRP